MFVTSGFFGPAPARFAVSGSVPVTSNGYAIAFFGIDIGETIVATDHDGHA
jgi:hypothetical protein